MSFMVEKGKAKSQKEVFVVFKTFPCFDFWACKSNFLLIITKQKKLIANPFTFFLSNS